MRITDEAVEAARTAVEQEAEAKKRFEEDTWVEGFAGDFARVAIQAALPHLEGATPTGQVGGYAPAAGEGVRSNSANSLEGATPVADRKHVEQVLRDRLVASNFNDNLHEPLRMQSIDTWVDVLTGSLFAAGLFRDAGPTVPDHVHCEHRETQPDEYGAMRCTYCGLVF